MLAIGQSVQMALCDTTGATLPPRFTKLFSDYESAAPGVGKLLLCAVFLGLLVTPKRSFLLTDLLWAVVRQLL